VGVSSERPRMRSVEEWQNVYDLLDAVRHRPNAWVRNGSLEELAVLIFGYHLALRVHDADEACLANLRWMPSSGSWMSTESFQVRRFVSPSFVVSVQADRAGWESRHRGQDFGKRASLGHQEFFDPSGQQLALVKDGDERAVRLGAISAAASVPGTVTVCSSTASKIPSTSRLARPDLPRPPGRHRSPRSPSSATVSSSPSMARSVWGIARAASAMMNASFASVLASPG